MGRTRRIHSSLSKDTTILTDRMRILTLSREDSINNNHTALKVMGIKGTDISPILSREVTPMRHMATSTIMLRRVPL